MSSWRTAFIAITVLAVAPTAASAATPSDLAEFLMMDVAHLKFPGDVALCASVDGVDVRPALLASLRERDARFVPASECVYVMDVDKGSYHRQSGRKAFFVSVSGFKDLPDGSQEVKTAVRHHGLWAIYKTLVVQKRGGKWEIVRVKEHVEA